MPQISVIVPVYNVEKYLHRCVDSILAQTFTDFELILVDDGSSDNSGIICDEYAGIHNNVKIIHQKNQGVSVARNVGLDIAEGEFIAFIDSDDTVDKTYLEILYQNGEFDFVTAGFNMQYSDCSWHKYEFPDITTDYRNVSSYPSKFMGKYYFGSPWAKLYKRKIIKENNIFFPLDIHSGEDTIFIFRYLKYVTIIKILPLSGYNYYFYETSLVHKKSNDILKWKIAIEHGVKEFFVPCNEDEEIWLHNRNFNVLVSQVKEQYLFLKEDVYTFFNDEIFEDAIKYKRRYGSLIERLFIYTMSHKSFELYLNVCCIENFAKRVKNRIKRTFMK